MLTKTTNVDMEEYTKLVQEYYNWGGKNGRKQRISEKFRNTI
jgi:hypothetical protein